MPNYTLPPDPTNAVLKKIYPWDEYNTTLVLQWLYAQAKKTGFIGNFEDFKLRYGAYIDALDPQDIHDIIENYNGPYHITPMESIEQVLKTKNKILNHDIVVDPIPDNMITHYDIYNGNYQIIPMANLDQFLRTKNRVLEDNIVIEKIPFHQVDNAAGGRTITIG